MLLRLDTTFPAWRKGPARYGGKWASIECEMQTHFPGFDVKRKKLQSICTRGRGKRQLHELQNRLKVLGLDMHKQNVDAVKVRERNAEESTKDAHEVAALQAAVKKLEQQSVVEVAAGKAAATEAERLKIQSQQVVEAKEDLEKVNVLLTKKFEHLMMQFEARKERDKKRIAVLVKQLEGERAANTELLRALGEGDGTEDTRDN
ncbi:hypothetical protein GN244_ATG11624 [Phytophthora infestans]|uniref:Uncharacterized protein n=1 Tax=Phytophthora infestans TaxID=4787 RepID=A0A833RZP0_PHYIN|nr:hypothetical protein GN244_ATG11624 [Phytophthora infestans]KAF4142111.1 hypothetical protein GN958_ATG08698 [Phytophthora infestans]KAF4148147.1 hypothetical protein GN958_ATG02661 [Phytophthora infestans]